MKLRLTMTVVREYDFDHKSYQKEDGSPMTLEEAIECDREATLDDPWAMIDEKAKVSVQVEKLP